MAISPEGVGEALRRSSAAMAAGNNTLEETVALLATANEIVQDPSVVFFTNLPHYNHPFLCWKILKSYIPQRKDEKCLNVMV